MAYPTTSHKLLAAAGDRRRTPRHACNGEAQIACLPLRGSLLTGKIRDLGLGGCCIEHIETASALVLGSPTEILLEVNSWFFRAMGRVRAVRARSGISVEFLRMSAGGSSMLRDLIAELERTGVVGTSSKLLLAPPPRSALVSVLHDRPAIVGTIVPAHSAAEIVGVTYGYAGLRASFPPMTLLDIFV